MNGVNRRVMGSSGDAVKVELPDYWRLDVTTTEVNEHVFTGYYSLDRSALVDVIVDGVSDLSVAHNSDNAYIEIASPGKHTIYIKVNLPYVSAWYGFAIKEREYDYVRAPYHWDQVFITGNAYIKVFDALPEKLALAGNSYNSSWTIDELGIPKGTKDYYMTTQYNGVYTMWSHAGNIVERNFKYDKL